MDQNENKNYNFENDPGQTQPGSAGAENQQGTQDVYGQQGAQGAYGQPDVAANSGMTQPDGQPGACLLYTSDLYNNGTTMQDNIKDSVMQSLFDMYTLEAHMAEYDVELTEDDKAEIADTAAAFIADNSKDALDALGADEETVERYLTLATIQNRMHTAIIADADTNVTDEEANTSSYSYVKVSKQSHTDEDGNTVEYTDTELTLLGKTVGMFDMDAKAALLASLRAAGVIASK